MQSAAANILALAGSAWLLAAIPGLATPIGPEGRTVSAPGVNLRLERIAGGLVHPWALAPLPDGRLLVTERNDGRLRIVGRDGRLSAPVEGVPRVARIEGETARSQGGLFDVQLHPDFARNREIFLSFAKPTERGAGVAVVRARLAEGGGGPRLENLREIFLMKPEDQDGSSLHFGGRMALDRDSRHLFLAIGDRRNISRSQDVSDQAGSILRMTLDGQPAGATRLSRQPGADMENDRPDPFIHATGSRNSQALAIEPRSGMLWSAEHGPKGGDRIDRIGAGANLGWPYYTAGKDYSGAPLGERTVPQGMQAPVHVFAETVAPSGAAFHNGRGIPAWRDRLLVGSLTAEALMLVSLPAGRAGPVEKVEIGRRVRDVRVAPDGAVWMVTDHADGEVLRLAPAR